MGDAGGDDSPTNKRKSRNKDQKCPKCYHIIKGGKMRRHLRQKHDYHGQNWKSLYEQEDDLEESIRRGDGNKEKKRKKRKCPICFVCSVYPSLHLKTHISRGDINADELENYLEQFEIYTCGGASLESQNNDDNSDGDYDPNDDNFDQNDIDENQDYIDGLEANQDDIENQEMQPDIVLK